MCLFRFTSVPCQFLCLQVGTSFGSVHCIDCRTDTPLWELSAHAKEVTGIDYKEILI